MAADARRLTAIPGQARAGALGLWLLVLVGALALVVAGMLNDVGRKA